MSLLIYIIAISFFRFRLIDDNTVANIANEKTTYINQLDIVNGDLPPEAWWQMWVSMLVTKS